MNNLTIFYVARHGRTNANDLRIIAPNSSELNETGEAQAADLAKNLQHISFDLIFSSDLLRAKRTAEIIALERNLIVQTTELLRERVFGEFEGKSYEAMHTYDLLVEKLTDQERMQFSQFGVESMEKMTTRVMTFLRETAVTHPGKTVLVLSHGGLIHSMLLHLGYGTYKTFTPFHIHNTAYIKLESDGAEFWVKEASNIDPPKEE